jgi:hypothetical protein
MAVEITIIKEDIKKDLTNFLIGVAQAGISEDVFPDLVDLITKGLSPTLDVSLFADNLIELLKRGNNIKDKAGADFAPLIASIQKGSPFLDVDGDSVAISVFDEEEPRPHEELPIDISLNANSSNKADSSIKDDRNEDFKPTGNANEKIGDELSNVSGYSAEDPSLRKEIIGSATGDADNKTEPEMESFITTLTDDKGDTVPVNPFTDNTLGAYRKREDEIDIDVPVGNNKDSKTIGNKTTLNTGGRSQDVTAPFTPISIDGIRQFGEKEINSVPVSTEPKNSPDISTAIQNSVNEILINARSERQQNQLEILLYNAIPYGITQSLAGIGSFVNGFNSSENQIPYVGSNGLDLADIATAALSANNLINSLTYLSAAEIGLYVGGAANFYTLHFRRGITIKDMRITPKFGPGIEFTVGAVEAAQYSNSKKLRVFGAPPSDRVENFIRKLFPGISNDIDEIRAKQEAIENYSANPPEYDLGNYSLLQEQIQRERILEEKRISPPTEPEEPKAKTNIEYSINAESGSIDIKYSSSTAGGTDSVPFKFNGGSIDRSELTNQLRDKEDIWKIGALYIWPIAEDGTINPKYVPFQFNPTIVEAGMAARYTATTILSRIGNIQSFTGTDNLTITLNTSYVPISRTENESFNIKDIQLIELAYRSLTLPWFSESTSDEGYRYYKPPLLKVIMGDYKKVNSSEKGIQTTNSPFSNLLTYPNDVLNGKISGELRHFKTFIATSCSIVRTDDMPYFLDPDDDYQLKDTFGYNISMSLTEITPSYHQIFPNFKDYFSKSNPKFGSSTSGGGGGGTSQLTQSG